MHPQSLQNTTTQAHAFWHVRGVLFFIGYIMCSLKSHPCGTANRLSGPVPAHTASVLLLAGPPEAFSKSVFCGSYCKWKHFAPAINYPPDWCHIVRTPRLAARQTADLYFYIERFQNVAGRSDSAPHEPTEERTGKTTLIM